MAQIYKRRGKDLYIKWKIFTDGEAVSLEGRDLALIRTNPSGRKIRMDWKSTGNTLEFYFRGRFQVELGTYKFELWERIGKKGQTVLDSTDSLVLVNTTESEGISEDGVFTAITCGLTGSGLSVCDGANHAELEQKIKELQNIILKYHPEATFDGNPVTNAVLVGVESAYTSAVSLKLTQLNLTLDGNLREGSGKIILINDTTAEEKTLASGMTLTSSNELDITVDLAANCTYRFMLIYEDEYGTEYKYLLKSVSTVYSVEYDTPSVYFELDKKSANKNGDTIKVAVLTYSQTKTLKSGTETTTEEITSGGTVTWKLVSSVNGNWQETTIKGVSIDASTGTLTFDLNATSQKSVNVMCSVTMNGKTGSAVVTGITQEVNTETTVVYKTPVIKTFKYSSNSITADGGKLVATYEAYQPIVTTKADGTYTESEEQYAVSTAFSLKEPVSGVSVDTNGDVTFDKNSNTTSRQVTIVATATVSNVTGNVSKTVTAERTLTQLAADAVYNVYSGIRSQSIDNVDLTDDEIANADQKTLTAAQLPYMFTLGGTAKCKWVAVPANTEIRCVDPNNIDITDSLQIGYYEDYDVYYIYYNVNSSTEYKITIIG